MTKRLVVIDGKSVFYRGYYAMPHLSTADGTPTGGVYGFASIALEIIRRLAPDYVAVAWDKPKTNIRKRLEMLPTYKAGRKPAPADFYAQIPILHELLDALGWPLYELDDYEADDIMATLAYEAEQQGIETCLVTSDLDALQSISPLTQVYELKKGVSNIDQFDPRRFEEKYGLRVDQFLDFKALKGDSSDNIPGVPGVGEKTAADLLQRFETLNAIYEHLDELKPTVRTKLEAGRESAYLSKKVAKLWTDAPVPLDREALDVSKYDAARLREILTRLEFRSLLARVPANGDDQLNAVTTPEESLAAVEISPLSTESRVILTMAQEVAVCVADDESLLISATKNSAIRVNAAEANELLVGQRVVVYGAQPLFHWCLDHDFATLPMLAHDVRQAAFLLNPLRRSTSLADLVAAEKLTPEQSIAAIWRLYDDQTAEFAKSPELSKVAHEIDFPLMAILARMEHRGILLNTACLDDMNAALSRDIAAIEAKIYDMVGREFNIASPAQLAEALFVTLQLPTIDIKKGKTGYSTGQKELNKLRGKHPIVEQIEQFRELNKLQNTYVEALPKLVDTRGRIHTTFNQDVTATGRLSSTDPNLQNIPIRTERGRAIRDAFVPEPGNVFVNADYSQFELRLAAVMADEKDMIAAFNSGADIHAKTASEVYGIPLDDVTKTQRRAAKVINFGILYGMSSHGLAAAANMTFSEAKRFIDEYFRIRPKLRAFIDDTIAQAHDKGYVETMFGRRRPTPDVKSSNFMVRSSAERAAANMPVQGTEADLMKMAMIEVEKKLHSADVPLGEQLLQIHDSIMVECPRENAEIVSDLLQKTMENIYPALGIALKVDVSIGNNWGEV